MPQKVKTKNSENLLENLNDKSKVIIVATMILAGAALAAAYAVKDNYSSYPPRKLTCRVENVEGASTNTVRVVTSYNGANKSFDYDMGEVNQEAFSNKPSIFFYTYSTPGSYQVTVSNSEYNNGEVVSCQLAVVNETSGSEVTP